VKELVFTRRFERDFRRLKKKRPFRPDDYATLEYLFELLQSEAAVPEAFRQHPLRGELAGFFECHIDADCLLVYRITRHRVVFHRIGTHTELFRSSRRRG
jgi:mRNA interferase YafQ